MVYTSPTKVARIADYKSLGMSNVQIAEKIGIHRTTVARVHQRFEKSGDAYHINPKSGRPRKLDVRDARRAAILLARTECHNATEVAKKVFPDVSRQTVARALKEKGLVCRVRRSKPYISPTNKKKRHAWARAHCGWSVEDWKRVGFSDESKFLLFKSDGRQYAWFTPGQALDDRYIKKNIKHGAGSLMVWGMITAKGMGRLHRIEGIMCGPDYVEILQKSMLGSLRDLKLKRTGKDPFIFQQDNDPKHRPDMSIIEHVWDQVDALVRARNPLPTNKDQLWEALQEEWNNFPMAALEKLYESMPRRVTALLRAKGGSTKY
ncbi:hypothetical protein ONZ45_g10230 [Pleurotus djamor]|nr:hypothetical protein ONZ45_g10230 [Pleurotus djamor]